MALPIQRGSVLTAADAAASDFFGISTSLNDTATILAVGAQGWEGGALTNQGGVYIYDWSGSAWVQRGSVLAPSDSAAGDSFGISVSLNGAGTVLAVGAHTRSASSATQGGVYIFDWSGATWVQRGGVILAADGAASDNFGTSVALSGDASILAVGAQAWEGSFTDQGGVYIYDWSGAAWIQRGTVLTALDAAASDFYGRGVALNGAGTILAVGAVVWEGTFTDQGGVYIYDWSGSAWVQRGSVLTAADAALNDQFGTSLSFDVNGTVLAVGAPLWEGTFTDQGGIYIFDWSGTVWIQRGSVLTASDAAASNSYGASVSLSSDATTFTVGASLRGGSFANQGGVYVYDYPATSPIIGNISITGLVPSYPAYSNRPNQATLAITGFSPTLAAFSATPTQGTVLVQGQAPTLGWFNQSAVQGSLAITGATPALGQAYISAAPTIATIALTGNSPFLAPVDIFLTGRGFLSALNPSTLTVTGRGFSTAPVISYTPDLPNTVTGTGFATVPAIYGGSVVTGSGFAQTPAITILASNEFTVIGRGLATQLGFSFIASSNINISGQGFATAPSINGGSLVTGRGFGSALGFQALTSESITVTGRGFGTVLNSYAIAPTTITVTGYGFSSGLQNIVISGQGLATYPVIQFTSAFVNTDALVMNVLTNEVSRYTNYPFMHIVTIGGKAYGVKADGLYLLSGSTDITATINGTIITKDTDFGIYQSKNVPYIYLNGDDSYTVTPIVDEKVMPSVRSTFKGRKAHPGRGNKGRYWSFKIEGVQELQGVEYLPDTLQRRVK